MTVLGFESAAKRTLRERLVATAEDRQRLATARARALVPAW